MGEYAAVCSSCEKAAEKIYEGYVCADCRINVLEETKITADYYREMYEEIRHELQETKESYAIFDKDTSLVFIQRKTGDDFTVLIDGKEVKGLRRITIHAGIEEFTTHEIEYVTGFTKETD